MIFYFGKSNQNQKSFFSSNKNQNQIKNHFFRRSKIKIKSKIIFFAEQKSKSNQNHAENLKNQKKIIFWSSLKTVKIVLKTHLLLIFCHQSRFTPQHQLRYLAASTEKLVLSV